MGVEGLKEGVAMKRSGSEWNLDDFLIPDDDDGDERSAYPTTELEKLLRPLQKAIVPGTSFAQAFGFVNPDPISCNSAGGLLPGSQIWSQNLTPKHSSISATIDSQSSLCGIFFFLLHYMNHRCLCSPFTIIIKYGPVWGCNQLLKSDVGKLLKSGTFY